MSKKKFKVTLIRSLIGCEKTQRATVECLGLRRLHHSVVLNDSPAFRGQVLKVQHLVTVSLEK